MSRNLQVPGVPGTKNIKCFFEKTVLRYIVSLHDLVVVSAESVGTY